MIDFPNSSKAKKYFLCLCAGTAELNYRTPSARGVGLADGAAEENEDGDGGSNGGMRFEMGRVSPKCVYFDCERISCSDFCNTLGNSRRLLLSSWFLFCFIPPRGPGASDARAGGVAM